MAITDDEIQAIGRACAEHLDARIDERIAAHCKTKYELVWGMDCTNQSERAEARKDHEFLRKLRLGSQAATNWLLWGILSLMGAGALALAAFGLRQQIK